MSFEIHTCYRHPDHRAGVRCQRCERPICPSCMVSAAVGFHCPECARQGRQRVYTAANLQAIAGRPYLTYALIAVNVAVLVGGLLVRGGQPVASRARFAADWGLFGPTVADGEWWRVFTAGFLHADLLHLGFNMFALSILGPMLERALGRVAFAVLYLAALVTGSLGVLLISPNALTVGASGAIFGLLGAAIVGQRAAGIDPRASGLAGWLVFNLVFTFLVPGISIGGHLGGLVGGFVVGGLLFGPAKSRVVGVVFSIAVAGAGVVASLWLATNPVVS